MYMVNFKKCLGISAILAAILLSGCGESLPSKNSDISTAQPEESSSVSVESSVASSTRPVESNSAPAESSVASSAQPAESSEFSSEEEPPYSEPPDPYPADRVYPDDELFPDEWLRLDSHAEFTDRLAEAMASDTTVTDPEEAVKALMDRNMFFICILFYGGIFDIDWDSPRDYSDYRFPIYPCTSKYFNNVKDISDLAHDTYSDNSVADSLLYGAERRPRWLEIDGQMYVDNTTFPLRGGVVPFAARTYIEITDTTDDKCTFILHYPDLEMLSPPESGYEFHYYTFGPYTAERTDGKWKLNEYVINTYG